MTLSFFAIIPAAGSGERFGGQKKQFVTLGGKTLLQRVVETFVEAGLFEKIIVAIPPSPRPSPLKGEGIKLPSPSLDGRGLGGGWNKLVEFVEGGRTRAESVRNGFHHLSPAVDDIVLIHDAARPLVSVELIKRVAEETERKKAVIPMVPLSDTVKEIRDRFVVRTLDRRNLVAVQTPQGYSTLLLKKAYQSVDINDPRWTDEAAMIESIGEKVHVVEGERRNIKVTTVEDMKLAQALLTIGLNKDII